MVEREVEENILNAADALSSPNQRSIKLKGFFTINRNFSRKSDGLVIDFEYSNLLSANLRDSLKEILFA